MNNYCAVIKIKMIKIKKCKAYDKLITEGWFDNESEALPWIMARKVFADDIPIKSGGEMISTTAVIKVKEYYKRQYVNKGGLKLNGAIEDFKLDINGKVALDCGASTGGFTDCLLLHGVKTVYAVDVGFGQLAAKLQHDDRVINMERTNLSDEILTALSPSPELITLDLSYLSLKAAIPICKRILNGHGDIIALVKPIFEVESNDIRRTGDINDREIHKRILTDLYEHFTQQSYYITGITNSQITGNNGTIEYFMRIEICERTQHFRIDYLAEIESAINRAFNLEKFIK